MAQVCLGDDFVKCIETFFGVECLKEFQSQVLCQIAVKKKDCLVCVPTGSGKSMCYEALSLVWDRLGSSDVASGTTTTSTCAGKAVCLLISPLVSLINIQVERLTDLGFPAISVVGCITEEDKLKLERCDFRYLVGNPESFLYTPYLGTLLKSEIYQQCVSALVFDEVHTAVSWGLSLRNKPAFRSFFSKVGDLRAKFPLAPILGLTATASKTTLSTVKSLLAMREPYECIQSADRPNIRLHVQKVPRDGMMQWLAEGVRRQGNRYPKTLVYCRSISECAELYGFFEETLGKNSVDIEKRYFDMVHSKTMSDVKNGIIDRLMDIQGQLVVVFATKVLGMGIDIRCSQIVHFGPPGTVDDYIQQIGRAGRDGTQAHAILIYHGKQLRNLDKNMSLVVKNRETCVRELVLDDFHGQRQPLPYKHLCCNICADKCLCKNCDVAKNRYERFLCENDDALELEEEENDIVRTVSDGERHQLHVALLELKSNLDREVCLERTPHTPPYLMHGLDETVINQVLDKTSGLFCVDDIMNKCAISYYSTACRVLESLASVFTDVDPDVDDQQDEYVYNVPE